MICRVGAIRIAASVCLLAILAGDRSTCWAAEPVAASNAKIQIDAIPLGPVSSVPSMWFMRADGIIQPQPVAETDPNIAVTDGGGRVVLLATKGTQTSVFIDGQQGSWYREVPFELLPWEDFHQPAVIISPDRKRVAYLARKADNQVAVVVDHVESPAYDVIHFIAFGPTGRRLIYVAQRGPKLFLVDDGKEGPLSDEVDVNTIRFSADGQRLAYVCVAQNAAGVKLPRLMIDGRPSPSYGHIDDATFSQDGMHLAYVVGGSPLDYRAVVDGVAGIKYGNISGGMLDENQHDLRQMAISRDGAHVAYIARRTFTKDNRLALRPAMVVIDGKEGPEFDVGQSFLTGVSNIVISPDGRRIVYVGETVEHGRHVYHVIENGKQGPAYDSISKVLFSPDSKMLFYFATSGEKGVAVIDGQESNWYDSSRPVTVIFSRDGRHVAWLDRNGRQSIVALDGNEIEIPNSVATGNRELEFLADDRHLAYYEKSNKYDPPRTVILGDAEDAAAPPDQIVFSGNGKHVAKAFPADRPRRGPAVNRFPRLSIDGRSQDINCLKIGKICLSDDGQHYACITFGRNDQGMTTGFQVNHDGRVGPICQQILDIAMSPDGRHVAYITEDGGLPNRPGIDRIDHVVVDGLAGLPWQGLVPTHAPTQPYEAFKAPEFLNFRADGSLWFLAASDGTLYRCRYSSAALDQMPTFEQTSTPAPPPAAAAARGTNFAAGPAGVRGGNETNIDAAATVRHVGLDESLPGTHVLFEFNAKIQERQGSELMALVVAGDSLYGVNRSGGKNGDGLLFKLSLDRGQFSVVRHFDRQVDGYNPTSLVASADGSLFGTFLKNVTVTAAESLRNPIGPDGIRSPNGTVRVGVFQAAGVFHYDPKTQAFEVFDKTVPADLNLSSATLCVVTHDRAIFGICGQRHKQMFRMSPDGKEVSMLKNTEDWGPFVDGGDGYFYGSNWDGLAKIKHDGSDLTMLHTFAGGDDGDAAVGPPVLAKNQLFGYASASPVRASGESASSARPKKRGPQDTRQSDRAGILYKIGRDGSSYSVIDALVDDPQRHGPLLAADDGSAIYGASSQGLYKIATESGTRAIFAPVDTHNSSRTHYMVLRAIHENSLYLSATTDIGRFDIDAPQTIAPQQIAPPAESPPEAATHDVPSAPEPIVSMRIFKPIPLVVEPMKWSTAPK